MSWFKKLNPFAKDEEATATTLAGMPTIPADLANDPKTKGMMGTFLRKWKDPAFMKQIRTLTLHMQREGIDIKDQKAVMTWIEKNKDRIESGELNEAPKGKPGETFVKTGPDVGRNDPCHCGSGKKFKKCHGT